jgi:hypothetical protein
VSSEDTGKIIPVLALKAYMGEGIWFHSFLTSALDGGEWLALCHSHFIRKKIAPSSGVS